MQFAYLVVYRSFLELLSHISAMDHSGPEYNSVLTGHTLGMTLRPGVFEASNREPRASNAKTHSAIYSGQVGAKLG